MIIRPAMHHDRRAIAPVHAASWREAYRGILPDRYLENDVGDDLARQWRDATKTDDDVVMVAEDTAVIGFIAVWCRPDPFIDSLHVLPDRRSNGLGRQPMTKAAHDLVRHGHTTAHLWVLEDNRRTIAFYERLGGQKVETKTNAIFSHDLAHVKIAWTDLEQIPF